VTTKSAAPSGRQDSLRPTRDPLCPLDVESCRSPSLLGRAGNRPFETIASRSALERSRI
jgi:hypothetical protein